MVGKGGWGFWLILITPGCSINCQFSANAGELDICGFQFAKDTTISAKVAMILPERSQVQFFGLGC